MILAFAGRRVDAPGAEPPRFPLANVDLVRTRVRALLQASSATAIVSSAACGADLIALGEAGALGLRRKVVLPFSRDRFRNTSVTDRPGNWGPVYDKILDEAADVIILEESPDDDAYLAANRVILEATVAWMNEFHEPGGAVLVWEGKSKVEQDFTEKFGIEARRKRLEVFEVRTL